MTLNLTIKHCFISIVIMAITFTMQQVTVNADEPDLFNEINSTLIIESSIQPQQTGRVITGTLNSGADYRIRVPDNWDGQTLLVYAHGYCLRVGSTGQPVTSAAETALGGVGMETLLVAQGYAVAGAACHGHGWEVKESISDTLTLTTLFSNTVGRPQHTIIWGSSMGSVTTLHTIETYPDHYDGAISLCSVGAGSSMTWDGTLAFALAYDVTLGWPDSWGTVGDVRDNIDFFDDVAPTVALQALNPANKGLFEFIRLVGDITEDGFLNIIDGVEGTPWIGTNMFYVTEARAELEGRAGGAVVQNETHTYNLSQADKDYLTALGVDADVLLSQMNARTTITPSTNARAYLEQYADYTGNLSRPVLMMHNNRDGFIPPYHNTVYYDKVATHGKTDLLYQTYTDAVGHCVFTADQLLNTITVMDNWLTNNTPPVAADFTAAGFLQDYEPGNWPIQFNEVDYYVALPLLLHQ